jgi:hypothetical protein
LLYATLKNVMEKSCELVPVLGAVDAARSPNGKLQRQKSTIDGLPAGAPWRAL